MLVECYKEKMQQYYKDMEDNTMVDYYKEKMQQYYKDMEDDTMVDYYKEKMQQYYKDLDLYNNRIQYITKHISPPFLELNNIMEKRSMVVCYISSTEKRLSELIKGLSEALILSKELNEKILDRK